MINPIRTEFQDPKSRTSSPHSNSRSSSNSEEEARAIHASALIINANDASAMNREIFERMRHAGVTAVKRAVASSALTDFRDSLKSIARWIEFIDVNRDLLLQASTVEHIRRAKLEGKTAIIFGFENTSHLEGELSLLHLYKKLGICMIQLTYNSRNLMGDGCAERTDGGLSQLGIDLIEAMNKLGIVVDISHCSKNTRLEAIEISELPVVASHSNARVVCDNPRNMTDEEIKALSEKDGVVGVVGFPSFVKKNSRRPTVDDLIDHIDYIANMVGVEHVGIGLDQVEGRPKEEFHLTKILETPQVYGEWPWHFAVETVSDFPKITERLLARGYSPSETKNILGANFLRVFERVWR